ncbi:hypothetical protein DRO35_01050 [Candidatus Bathyarchaeota archaeon]|nr:MAG: hypothetical protein DRO35_01050 [Candidatus Bathyarchaeota archaeon]
MVSINSVLGPISLDDLGVTLIHEHIVASYNSNYKAIELNYAISTLKKARIMGLKSLVEVTPRIVHVGRKGGRNIPVLQEVSRKSGVNILCCTGYYDPTPEVKKMTVEEITEIMVREIEEGINGTDVRAAIIKVKGNDFVLSEVEKKIFEAAAKAQIRTGVPIQTHCIKGLKTQFETLTSAGANPNHCAFAHVSTTWGWEGRSVSQQADFLLDFARRGACFVFDNLGWEQYVSHEDQFYLIRRLVDAGFADKVFIALDLNWRVKDNGVIEREGDSVNPESRKRDFPYLFTHGIPLLEEAGFSEKLIHKFLVENPKEYFTPF